jgi:hypothetical protein
VENDDCDDETDGCKYNWEGHCNNSWNMRTWGTRQSRKLLLSNKT